MPVGERDGLVTGPSSSAGNGGPGTAARVNKFRGLICWGIFGAFLIFFIVMAAVYTDPKRYRVASAVDYLTGEDAVLYTSLGGVFFEPSTRKLNAKANFQLGLLLMHVFWYDLAIVKFRQARIMDPNFAMAYWGEAMCYKQPLWQTEDLASAQAVLAELNQSQALKFASVREQQYVAAARALFAANTSLEVRETTYSSLMQMLWAENQDDADACALAGLSVLGQLQSVGNFATNDNALRYQAGELLDDCVHYFPNHAGALHYQTHLYDVDDTTWASEGQEPSLKLAKLAPKSNVAQHMASHIFIRFGNWTEVVASNQAAVAASDSYCNAVGQGNACDGDNRWHALEWQLYGQTQQCAAKAAFTSYQRMQTVAASMNYTGDYVQWLYRTYAHLQLQSLNSLGAIGLKTLTDNATTMLPSPLYNTKAIQNASAIEDHFWPPHAEAHALLARVYSLTFGRNASQLQAPGVNATVTAALARLDVIVATQASLLANSSAAAGATSPNAEMLTQLQIVQLQANALVGASACAANLPSCNSTAWTVLMEQALVQHATIAGSSTLPSLKIAPTPEFYGNLLIATNGNATTAKVLFEQCLQQLPGRMQCVLGLARASFILKDNARAVTLYAALQSQCSLGDTNFPALLEARSRIPPPSPPPPSKRGRRALRNGAVAA